MEEFDLQDSQLYNEDGIENEENELLRKIQIQLQEKQEILKRIQRIKKMKIILKTLESFPKEKLNSKQKMKDQEINKTIKEYDDIAQVLDEIQFIDQNVSEEMEQLQSSTDTEEEQQEAVISTRSTTKGKSSAKHPYKSFKRSYPELEKKRLSMNKKLSLYAQSRPRSHEGRFIPIRNKTTTNKENRCTREQLMESIRRTNMILSINRIDGLSKKNNTIQVSEQKRLPMNLLKENTTTQPDRNNDLDVQQTQRDNRSQTMQIEDYNVHDINIAADIIIKPEYFD
ncbi:PREDICTED: uncharacterized protein LOC105148764 [Acromyrmex echinatior]|uniref:Uncharacterized protein n=1 Tax=Acromyrmex echinatior TaxID=103372 RepID=F4WSS2_ACREC|nr:PREDICTED: uncharacterized protein LOC105148764 [Acromyrmex echinatior]EGI62729.1 hypothetical protein G5I_08899 [Acromyrmex echinatior]